MSGTRWHWERSDCGLLVSRRRLLRGVILEPQHSTIHPARKKNKDPYVTHAYIYIKIDYIYSPFIYVWFWGYLWELCSGAGAQISCSLRKSFGEVPMAKSDAEPGDAPEPDVAGRGGSQPLPPHPEPPGDRRAPDKSQPAEKRRSRPSRRRAISSSPSRKN